MLWNIFSNFWLPLYGRLITLVLNVVAKSWLTRCNSFEKQKAGVYIFSLLVRSLWKYSIPSPILLFIISFLDFILKDCFLFFLLVHTHTAYARAHTHTRACTHTHTHTEKIFFWSFFFCWNLTKMWLISLESLFHEWQLPEIVKRRLDFSLWSAAPTFYLPPDRNLMAIGSSKLSIIQTASFRLY